MEINNTINYFKDNHPSLYNIFDFIERGVGYFNTMQHDIINTYILTMSEFPLMAFCDFCERYTSCRLHYRNEYTLFKNIELFKNKKYVSCGQFRKYFRCIKYLNINLDNKDKIYKFFKLGNLKHKFNDEYNFNLYVTLVNYMILFNDESNYNFEMYKISDCGIIESRTENVIDTCNNNPESIEFKLLGE